MARTIERGYDKHHVKLRAQIQTQFDNGQTIHCWRCTKRIYPHQPWDLGHDDDDRTKYNGPEHASCNRAVMAHKAANTVDTSRQW